MLKLFLADLKMISRNRQALFWSFMFPVMFTVIFGLFFGQNTSVGTIDLVNKSNSELSQTFERTMIDSKMFTVNKKDNLDSAKEDVAKSKASAVVEVPETFGVMNPQGNHQIKVYYDPSNAQVGSVVISFVDKFVTNVNFQLAKVTPVYSVATEKMNNRELTYFDFVLSGVLGLALMNSSIIGIAVGMATYRQDKILKRITTTPVRAVDFVTAEVLSRLVLNFFQISFILLLGIYVFHAHIYGNIALIFLIAIFGALLFQLIGFVVASFSKTTDAAQGMATAITIPMMFLAGVFFPIDALPKWLYSIVQFLPLAPLLRIIRVVTLEGASPLVDLNNVAIIFAWIAVAFFVAVKRFKLNQE